MSSDSSRPEGVSEKKSNAAKIGPVSISLLIHLAFVMVIGSVVIIEQVIPKTNFKAAILGESFDQPSDEVVEPDEALPDPGAAANPELPMESTEQQTVSPENSMDVMTVNTAVASPWMVTGAPAVGAVGKIGPSGGGGTATSGSGKGPRMKNPFGELTRSAGSLQGVFYDLKQTPDRKPSGVDRNKYDEIMREFERKSWNPDVFKPFYKASQSVYATQLFIPLQSAAGAPKAFNVEKEVDPAQWVIVYEGTFSAPIDDKYRFVGYADDILLVRVNGETVLDGSRGTMIDEKWAMAKVPKQTWERGHKAGNGVLAYGKWLDLSPGKVQKIQVLLGENPGGQFCAYLMIEAKSGNYKKEANGRPILPLFQMAESDLTFDAEIKAEQAPSYAEESLLMSPEK